MTANESIIKKIQSWVIPGVIILGVLINLFVFKKYRMLQHEEVTVAFQIAAEERFATFEEAIEIDLSIVEALRSFYYASNYVDHEEFHIFSSSLIDEESSVKVVKWVPIIAADVRASFEDKIRKEEFPDFMIKEYDPSGQIIPAQERQSYFPATYIDPVEDHQHLLGVDLGADFRRREVFRKAVDRNELHIVPRLVEKIKGEQKHAFEVYLPVYSQAVVDQKLSDKQSPAKGFVSGIFYLEELFAKSIKLLKPQGIHSYLYDISENGKALFLHGQYSRLYPLANRSVPEVPLSEIVNKDYARSHRFDIGGRRWQLVFVPTETFISRYFDRTPYVIFIPGILLTLLTAYIFHKSFQHMKQVEQEVEERTRELNQANAELKVNIQKIAEQNKLLEQTKKATLNVMEDLQESQGDLKRLNQELGEQKSNLEKVNLELDRFTYTASHDLRAPLRAISSFATFLKEDYDEKLDEEGRDYIEEIIKGSDRMTRLIDDLLSLSRLSRIKNPYEKIQTNNLVDSIRERIEFDIKENNVDFTVESDMPTIIGDKIKLGEVFLNLINNAIKFSSKENKQQPKVDVGGKNVDGGYEFFVKDNGIGIDPQFHDQVFDLFKRLQKDRDYEGTGAGLSIVKRIIDDHHGRVWLDSAVGSGTTFFFFIPNALQINGTVDRGASAGEVPEYTGEI